MRTKILAESFLGIICSIFLVSCSTVSFDPGSYIAYTESLPPFILTGAPPEEKITGGIAYEIFQELQKRTGVKIPVKVMDWDRAYVKAEAECNTIIFPIAFIPSRQNKFKWVGPICKMSSYFYCSELNPIRLNQLSEARKYNIAVYKDDFLEQYLAGLGFSNMLVGSTPEENARMLMTSKVQLWAANESTVNQIAMKAGSNYKLLQKAFKIIETDLYFGFYKDTPDTVIYTFQTQLDNMKRDGTIKKIIEKYSAKQ